MGSVLTPLLIGGRQVTVVDNYKYNQTLADLIINPNFNLIMQGAEIDFIKSIINKFDFIVPLAALRGCTSMQ